MLVKIRSKVIGWAGMLSVTAALFATPVPAQETLFVTDQLQITLRSGTSTRHGIRKMLPSGAPLQVLERDAESGYTKVRTQGGTEGWVLDRYLDRRPPARIRLGEAEKRLTQLQTRLTELQKELDQTQGQSQRSQQRSNSLSEENARLKRELQEIRRVSENALKIERDNRELSKRVAEIGNSNMLLRQENESLRDRSARDWFVVGAVVVVCSMLFGILLTRIRWRKRSSWGDL